MIATSFRSERENKLLQDIYSEALAHKQKENVIFKTFTRVHFNVFEGDSQAIESVASAVEEFILALDIIDDIQDNDNKGAPWGHIESSQLINVALLLLATSMQQILKAGLPNTETALNHMYGSFITSIEGQYLDLHNHYNTEEEYIYMCRKKSGSLVAMSSLIGTALATNEHHEIVAEYASYIGIAAQISNDINDLLNFHEKSDWKLKKKTLPILFLLQQNDAESELIREYFNNQVSYDHLLENREEITQVLFRSGALIYANAVKKLYKEKALTSMKLLPISKEKMDLLIQVTLQNL